MPLYSKTTWVDGSLPAIDASKLNKIEQGIFDSLRQDGSTTMSGQLVTTAGSAATPAIAPTGDSNTGIFFPAADTLSLGTAGGVRVQINSSGNIGVGITDQSYKLDVAAYTATPLRVQRSGEYGEVLKIGRYGVSDGAGIGYPADNTFTIITNANERMRITSAGNVGIGTTVTADIIGQLTTSKLSTSPAQTAIAITGALSSGTSGHAILWKQHTTYTTGYITCDAVGSGAGTGLIFATTNAYGTVDATEKMRIMNTGNVGIGTISPARLLEISSGTNTYQRLTSTIEAICGLEFYTNSVNRALITGDSNGIGISTITATPIIFKTNNTEKMRITSAGNVGIGIDPTNKLHLYQNNTNQQYISISNATSTFLVGQDSSGNMVNYTNQAVNYQWSNSGTPRMTITSTGNVGIGTTSPSSVLHISSATASYAPSLRITNTGTSIDQQSVIALYTDNSTTNQFLIGKNSVANGASVFLSNQANSDMIFETNAVSRLYLQSGGTLRPAANNTYDLGSATYRWATIYAQNALNTSDARLKTDVAPSSLGLDFINQLNPVQYRWIEGGNTVEKVQTGTETVEISPAIPAKPEVLDEDGNVIQEATQEVPAVTEEKPIYETVVTPREGVRTHFGLIAQEVKAALPDGLDFAGWCLADKDDADSTQSLGYTQLIAPMIKAIQELKAEIEALKAQLNK